MVKLKGIFFLIKKISVIKNSRCKSGAFIPYKKLPDQYFAGFKFNAISIT